MCLCTAATKLISFTLFQLKLRPLTLAADGMLHPRNSSRPRVKRAEPQVLLTPYLSSTSLTKAPPPKKKAFLLNNKSWKCLRPSPNLRLLGKAVRNRDRESHEQERKRKQQLASYTFPLGLPLMALTSVGSFARFHRQIDSSCCQPFEPFLFSIQHGRNN